MANAYFNLGVIDQTNGALASAESNYGLALSADPNFVPALFNLASIHFALPEAGKREQKASHGPKNKHCCSEEACNHSDVETEPSFLTRL